MSNTAQQVAAMLDMLPEQEQNLAFELIKRMVMAWDSDFTKVTPAELEEMKTADDEIARGDIVRHSDIDWN